ncbi:hypothetical protein KR074_004205 [Drosophila pseudoananassae]|nr:hypothetical protein KR074_004205 [Drosophila pseudoananassae]
MNRDVETRIMIFGCTIENASNCRKERQNLAIRVSKTLKRSREFLLRTKNLQNELDKMKINISNALTISESEPPLTLEENSISPKETVRRFCKKLTAIIANYSLNYEFNPELIRDLLGRPDEEDLDEPDSIEEPTAEENVSKQPATGQE